jgi:ATP-dependent Lon protease
VVELAVEKGASVVLMPVSSRKQLFDLSDDLATKVTVVFYNDAREAFIKAIAD